MPISPYFTSTLIKDWEMNFTQCAPNGFLKYTDLCNILHYSGHADKAVEHGNVVAVLDQVKKIDGVKVSIATKKLS